MVIAMGNTKAGTGKSALLLLLAHHLCLKTEKVFLIELKENGSLGQFYERSKILEHRLPFEYFSCAPDQLPLLLSKLSEEEGACILLEFPPEGYDEHIVPLFLATDLLIVPFCYDAPTLHSTIYFACLALRIKKDISLLFLPNRLMTGAVYPFREETDRVLRQIAPVSAGIAEHIGFQRVSSMGLDKGLMRKCSAVLDLIYGNYLPRGKK